MDIFLTDIIDYDWLKLYLKIYTSKMTSWVRDCLYPKFIPSFDKYKTAPVDRQSQEQVN